MTDKCPECEGYGKIADPQHGQGSTCFKCGGTGTVLTKCEVSGCIEDSIKDRILCLFHAYPAERKKSGRRLAIEWTWKKRALQKALKDSEEDNR